MGCLTGKNAADWAAQLQETRQLPANHPASVDWPSIDREPVHGGRPRHPRPRSRAALWLLALLLPASLAAQQPARKSSPSAGLDSTLAAANRRLWEAVRNKDGVAFTQETAPQFLNIGPGGINRVSSADLRKNSSSGCEVKEFQFDSLTTLRAAPDAAVLSYHVQTDERCGGGPPLGSQYVTEFWVWQGGKWRLATLVWTPAQQPGAGKQ